MRRSGAFVSPDCYYRSLNTALGLVLPVVPVKTAPLGPLLKMPAPSTPQLFALRFTRLGLYWRLSCMILLLLTVAASSENGIYVLGKAHMRTTRSLSETFCTEVERFTPCSFQAYPPKVRSPQTPPWGSCLAHCGCYEEPPEDAIAPKTNPLKMPSPQRQSS